MQRHRLPDCPWSWVTADQFKLYGKEYLALVDVYSGFIEAKQLQDINFSYVIEFFKEQFSRYGIPDTLVKDNGPQFTSHEFHQFSRDWEFLRVSSFPHHHKVPGNFTERWIWKNDKLCSTIIAVPPPPPPTHQK